MLSRSMSPSGRLLLGFGALSLAAVLAGAGIVMAQGAPVSAPARNLATWVAGALAAGALAACTRGAAPAGLAWVAPLGLLTTLVGLGLEGVHRWLAIGPVQANMAMLLLPLAVVVFAARAASGWLAWAPMLLALPILAWQPDASQATAIAAVVVLVAVASLSPLPRLAVVAVAIAFAGWAWLRPDPLAPEPEVEGVIGLAWALSPAAAVAALLLLLGAAVAPVLFSRGCPSARLPALTLGALLLVWIAAPFAGAFPVPFAGISPSPILGAWLGVGLLAGLLRRPG
ncbi:MAG TPA: hypothetical protein VEA44_04600 [Caulobacter sp.]|nr:hypothetical protein [Caulobacter sp.]